MKKFFTILFIITSFFCHAQSKTLVITEVYGGGGNLNSTYRNDYIQLFNLSESSIDLGGYTLQIAQGNIWNTISLSGVVPANRWFLIKGDSDGSSGIDLPKSDVTANFNISTEGGKIALVNSNKILATACMPFTENVVDLIGYGNSDCSETAGAPAHTINSATSRINFAADANNNSLDFTVFPPSPKNTSELALPITLNVFNVSKTDKGNMVHWQVNCLSTSVTFALERSPDLRNFATIFSSTETKARCATPFDFKDNNPQNGENYYRLKIIDIDGHVYYSKISLSVNFIKGNNTAKVTPNIVSSVAELHFNSDKPGKIQLLVSDLQGRTIKRISFEAIGGDNKILITTGELSKGQYQAIIFTNEEKIASAKFVKQ